MVALARQGLSVVRLKSGDPLIFGRAGEEISACQDAGIPISVIPGVTSAQGAAANLKVSLTNREYARRLQFITAHDRHGHLPADIDWSAVADPAATTGSAPRVLPRLRKQYEEKVEEPQQQGYAKISKAIFATGCDGTCKEKQKQREGYDPQKAPEEAGNNIVDEHLRIFSVLLDENNSIAPIRTYSVG